SHPSVSAQQSARQLGCRSVDRLCRSPTGGLFFSSRRRHTRSKRDWSSDVCSSDLGVRQALPADRGSAPRGRRHALIPGGLSLRRDRKSTRLNSSHVSISYAVFCLKKKNICITHQNIIL